MNDPGKKENEIELGRNRVSGSGVLNQAGFQVTECSWSETCAAQTWEYAQR